VPLGNTRLANRNEKTIRENVPKQRVSESNGKDLCAESVPIGQQLHNGPKQRVSPRLEAERLAAQPFVREQRVSERIRRQGTPHLASTPAPTDFIPRPHPVAPPSFENMTFEEDLERYRLLLEDLERWDNPAPPSRPENNDNNGDNDDDPPALSCLMAERRTAITSKPMPKHNLPSVFTTRPLNLNDDGTPINYKMSHSGPHSEYWTQADGEEIERLFVTGTIKLEFFRDIPSDRVITYVNPICVEKTNDDGSIKFRTRLTIGGDRINYPYDTAAVTAEMDAIKILLNCMISENSNWSTIDLTDFYLGTDLPHPEYIRIPRNLIPEKVIAFYELERFFSSNALYCSVHKTHYGLPQAGALSQQRLFKHLQLHGYTQIPSSPSVFRNRSGTIRFTLVVDDFAVVWKDQGSINHFINTLTQLY
jgi:hypothetical protein